MRAIRYSIATFVLIASLCSVASSAVPPGIPLVARTYTRNDQLLIARALAEGRQFVFALIAADPSQVDALVGGLRSLGARVEYRSNILGYVRARVPIGQVDAVAALPQIQRIDIDADTQFDVELDGIVVGQAAVSAPSSSQRDPYPWPTPNSHTKQANAFTGVREVRAAAFKATHPTFDGRGVRIGFLEREDPMNPFLQHAKTLSGRVVPKLVDMRNAVRPSELSEESTRSDREYFGWVSMHDEVHAAAGHFIYHGRRYTAPYDGTFRIGMFALRDDVHFINVLHPNGTVYADSQHFPILWDVSRGVVWVDADQEGDFAKAHPMMDFHIRHDVGFLKLELKDWSTWGESYEPGEQIPTDFDYTIETDPADGYVAVHMPFHSIHGTGVSSTAVGQGYFGGAFDGVAPGAQIVSLVAGEAPYSGAIEALIDAASYPKVNLISLSWGACFFAQDGASVMDVIVNRMVDHYGVLPFISASNDGPAMSTLCSPSIANEAVSVGAYTSREMFAGNDGAAVANEDYLADYSSRGPRRDGGFKPDLVSPTEVLGAHPMVAPRQLLQHWLLLPFGYGITNGTSTAAPMAAGSAALLVSAAMQSGIPHDPLRIKRALVSGARQLLGYGAYEQGGGLIDVVAAWNELKKMAHSDPIVINATVPVRDISSSELTVPNQGEGIYEREGWQAGMMGSRAYTFTRLNGSQGDMTFAARWIHNDGTFSSASSVTLPLDAATSYVVHIAPRTAGAHSALLELIDPRTGAVADERMNVIVAAEQFRPSNHFTIVHAGYVSHPGVVHYFFNLPNGTGAFSVSLAVAQRSLVGLTNLWTSRELLAVHTPSGKPAQPVTVTTTNDGALWSQAFSHPQSGVWEVVINNLSPDGFTSNPRRLTPLPPVAFTLTARTIALQTQLANCHATCSYTLVDTMAPVSLRALSSPLGRLRRLQLTLTAAHPRTTIPITVPQGATLIRTSISEVTPTAGSDVDVYLFNCAQKSAMAKRSNYLYQGSCEFRVSTNLQRGGVAQDDSADLPAGRWVAVVAARHISGSSVMLRYSDAVMAPVYGTSHVIFSRAVLKAGDSTRIAVRVTRGKAIPSGTQLVSIPLLGDQNAATIYTHSHSKTIIEMLTEQPMPIRYWAIAWQTMQMLNAM